MRFIKLSLRLLPLFFCYTLSSYSPGQEFEITLSNIEFEEFIYEPRPDGYKYSYKIPEGNRHNEVGLVYDGTPNYYARNSRPTHRPGVKNRKLSPKSLQSLAG